VHQPPLVDAVEVTIELGSAKNPVSDMQIDDVAGSRQLAHIGLGLTTVEAKELRDTLDLGLKDSVDTHEHVSSVDYQTELTVWIQRESK
jgi:hypothetical protein